MFKGRNQVLSYSIVPFIFALGKKGGGGGGSRGRAGGEREKREGGRERMERKKKKSRGLLPPVEGGMTVLKGQGWH